MDVERFFQALIEQAREHEQEKEERGRFLPPKKYRPPHPMGVKGGCSPQNNLQKNSQATKRASGRSQQIFY
jgi:hypothetical protein